MAIAITPDGATAYVANAWGGTVNTINLATGRPGTRIRISGAEAIAITPDGKTAYVAIAVEPGFATPITVATGHPGTPSPSGTARTRSRSPRTPRPPTSPTAMTAP